MTLEAPLKRIEERAAEDLRRAESRLELHIARLEQQVVTLANSVNFMEKQLGRDIERHNTILLDSQKQLEKLGTGSHDSLQQLALLSHTTDVLSEALADSNIRLGKLKDEVKPLQAHMNKIDGVIKVAGAIATLIGVAATIYQLAVHK
jgi:chromosome segregation ATPase